MKRTKALRHRHKPKDGGKTMAAIWRDGLGRCAMYERTVCEGKVRGHHVVTRQVLRRRGLAEYLWDQRNRLALCDRHHRRHHNRIEPVPRCVLPAVVLEFAVELDLMLYVERYYATVEEE